MLKIESFQEAGAHTMYTRVYDPWNIQLKILIQGHDSTVTKLQLAGAIVHQFRPSEVIQC